MKNHQRKNALSFRLRFQGVLSQTSARFLYRFELFLFNSIRADTRYWNVIEISCFVSF